MNPHKKAAYAFVNDKIIPVADAHLHVSDLAIQRGYGIFDFFKIINGHPFFLRYHLDRLFHSAAIMKLTVPSTRPSIESNIRELISKNQLGESGIKIIVTGGYSSDGYQIAPSNLIFTQHTLTLPSAEQMAQGISIITHPYTREFAAAKTINYSMGIWLTDRINAEGAADVLYHEDELISEFPRSNIFVVASDGTVKTPSKNILKGITRNNILSFASSNQQIVEADITREQLYAAKEVFLTSTTKRVLPVVEVDHRKISDGRPGPVSLMILKRLMELERSDIK